MRANSGQFRNSGSRPPPQALPNAIWCGPGHVLELGTGIWDFGDLILTLLISSRNLPFVECDFPRTFDRVGSVFARGRLTTQSLSKRLSMLYKSFKRGDISFNVAN